MNIPIIGIFRPYIVVFDPKMGSIRHRRLSELIGPSCFFAFSAFGQYFTPSTKPLLPTPVK